MALNQSDFITPLTGNLVVANGVIRLLVQSNSDLNTNFEGNENFVLVLKKTEDPESVLLTSSPITLIDTSL
jgi:hypothetical protein